MCSPPPKGSLTVYNHFQWLLVVIIWVIKLDDDNCKGTIVRHLPSTAVLGRQEFRLIKKCLDFLPLHPASKHPEKLISSSSSSSRQDSAEFGAHPVTTWVLIVFIVSVASATGLLCNSNIYLNVQIIICSLSLIDFDSFRLKMS